MDDLLQQQLAIEREALEQCVSKAQRAIQSALKSGSVDRLPEGQLILRTAIPLVSKKIEELFELRGIRRHLHEFEGKFDLLAYVVIVSVLREVSRLPVTNTTSVLKAISRDIVAALGEVRMQNKGDTLEAFMKRRYKGWSQRQRDEEQAKIIKHLGFVKEGDISQRGVAGFAARFLDALIASGANIVETRIVYNKRNKKKKSVVVLTEDAQRLILESREWFSSTMLTAPPLVVPPKPWTKFTDSGGYHLERKEGNDVARSFRFTAIKRNVKATVNTTKLLEKYFNDKPEIRDATLSNLNKLAATEWKVNTELLEIMKFVFDNNIMDPTAPPKAPHLIGKLPVNDVLKPTDYTKPEDIGGVKQPDGSYVFPESTRGWRDWFVERDAVKDHVNANASRAIITAIALSTADKYKAFEKLYFTFQYDSRGRVYPIQSVLNPIGTDNVRALLQFANGEPINSPEALRWFKIHGANTYGYDKLAFDERVAKIDAMEDDIVNIASDPLKYRDLWGNTDSPWMFLAWCLDYGAYLKDPEHPVRTAVALDASCSGIQLYSGLLRDAEGAEATNVIGDTREDIYQRVADEVNSMLYAGDFPKFIEYSQSDGTKHSDPTQAIADSFKGRVDRSLVKGPVMTTPYSVTERGIKEQIVGQLDELERANDKYWVLANWQAAMFLAKVVKTAIDRVVKASRIGQDYLTQYAGAIKDRQNYVFYNSLLTQFPVLLSTARTEKKRFNTVVGNLTLRNTLDRLDTRAFKAGIAPNYIHSLDSTLLLETVRRLNEQGVTDYHLIHDSYGVGPNNVEALNRTVREVFVELFEAKPLQSLIDQTWPDYEHRPEDVMVNTLDLSEVHQSRYIFS